MDVHRAVEARQGVQESVNQPSDLASQESVAAVNTTGREQRTTGDAESNDVSEPLFDKSGEFTTGRSTANASADPPRSLCQAAADPPRSLCQAAARHRPGCVVAVTGCAELQVSARCTIRPLIYTDGCSPSTNSRQRVLVLVALNAAHVVLGVSAGSLAAGAYAVAAASASVTSDPPSAAACISSATFAVTGAFGLCQLLVCRRRARRRRGQRVAYTCLSAYSGIAALITGFFVAKQLAALAVTSPSYRGDDTKSANDSRVPLATCGTILLVLAAVELAVAGVACYRQSWQRRHRHRFGKHNRYLATDVSLNQRKVKSSVTGGDVQGMGSSSGNPADSPAAAAVAAVAADEEDAFADDEQRGGERRVHRSRKAGTVRMAKDRKNSNKPMVVLPQAKSTNNVAIRSRKLGLLLLMFNATHVAAGLCTLELALVGMTLAGRLDTADFTGDSSSDTAGLFTAALVSPLFLAAGSYGLYVILAGRLTVGFIRGAYVGICSAAAVGGTIAVGVLTSGAAAAASSKQSAAAAAGTAGQTSLEWQQPKLVLLCLVWLATGAGVIACVTTIVVTLYFTRRIHNKTNR